MFSGSTAGGLQSGPTTGNIATRGDSGGGGSGDGLDAGQVQALIDTSLAGAVQPSSVTTSGQVKTSAGFSFDVADEGEESEIVRESNGGLVLRRGFATFLTCSPFSGCVFGVNLTTGNLTVNGTFTASGGISGVYSSAVVDNLLSAKQPTITTGSLPISHVANLQSSLDAKQSLLSDRDGTGVSLRDGNSVLRRIFGVNGISVTVPLNIGDPTDPENFQLKLDGSALQTAIAAKQNAITSSSSLTVADLTVSNPTGHTNVLFQNTNSGYTNFDLSAQGCAFRAYPFSGGPC